MKRLVVLATLAVLALVAMTHASSSADAAVRLVVSNPPAGAELSEPPGWVSLAFDARVKRSLLKVLVVNSAGRNVVVGDLIYQGSAVMVQLEDGLAKDTYTVKYQVNRKDGQPEGGAFQFSYGKGQWTPVVPSWSGTAEQPPEMANPDPMATGPVETPTATPPVVEVSDAPTESARPTDSATAGGSPGSVPTATGSAVPVPEGGAGTGAGLVPWIVGGALLVVAGVVGWALIRRKSAKDD